jgi:GNAT superfamily N-acetyltransferase
VRVRSASPSDEAFIGELAGEVFAIFGDYRPLLPRWFRSAGVLTYISEHDDERTGYLMLAFFKDGKDLVGDVLAIAVAPGHQNRGIGRVLMEHAIQACERAAEQRGGALAGSGDPALRRGDQLPGAPPVRVVRIRAPAGRFRYL